MTVPRADDSRCLSAARLRIGAVSYLNTKPLVYRLGELASSAELIFDLPSRLADELAAGRLDIALIPSIELLQNPAYTIVSDACIACRGPVLSVKLLSRTPIDAIRTVALDEGSRTSAALVRILLHEQYGLSPQWTPLPIGASVDDCNADAVLLIGDRAIHTPPERFVEVWDLGERWRAWSGLPFVFAMWTAREGVEPGDIDRALSAARDAGLDNLAEIARQQAPVVGLTEQQVFSYLSDNLYFRLGPREQHGLQLFCQYAARLDLAPEHFELRFHGCETYR